MKGAAAFAAAVFVAAEIFTAAMPSKAKKQHALAEAPEKTPIARGIDVSNHQGKIDWQAVKDDGVQFAIIRLGYGDDDTTQDDSRFLENVAGCEAAGIPWGAYIYSYALTIKEAQSEAVHCLRLLKGKTPSYPVCFDMEDADGYKARHGGLTKETAVAICDTFLSEMQSAGYYVSLYASLTWLNGILNDDKLESYDKWVAQWNDVCEYEGDYGMWQYGASVNYIDTTTVNGIEGTVDKDFAYKDYPRIIRSANLNGWQLDAPTAESHTENSITLSSDSLCEYSKDGENWQSSPTFTGLLPNTVYKFYKRISAANGVEASEKSPALTAVIPAKPTLLKGTYNEIFLRAASGLEYSLDNNNWQESGDFYGLTPNTEYTVYTRIKHTDEEKIYNAAFDTLTLVTDNHGFYLGSVTGSGTITEADLTMLSDYVAKNRDSLPDISAADINGDCKIDICDCVKLMMYLKGKITDLS